jgi:hypothetical protein
MHRGRRQLRSPRHPRRRRRNDAESQLASLGKNDYAAARMAVEAGADDRGCGSASADRARRCEMVRGSGEGKREGIGRGTAESSRFVLRFPVRTIAALATAYRDDREAAAFAAGRRIAGGGRSRRDLTDIIEWKTRGRGRSRSLGNSDEEIADALDLALAARTERAATAVLTGLVGVDVPVASAILTAIDPMRFTVIDFRALFSLAVERDTYSVAFYLEYLAACRRIAAEAGTDLRTLDRALWQHSKDRQPPRRSRPSGKQRLRSDG